ncbi:MAG: hypothetical protein AB8G86_10485 [Saprospiraceae bacterium]
MKFDFQIAIDQPEKFTFAVKNKINTNSVLSPLQVDDEGLKKILQNVITA